MDWKEINIDGFPEKPDEMYLVYDILDNIIETAFYENRDRCRNNWYKYTHWMEIPEPTLHCVTCGGEVSKEYYQDLLKHGSGEKPTCSRLCFEIEAGVPMPWGGIGKIKR